MMYLIMCKVGPEIAGEVEVKFFLVYADLYLQALAKIKMMHPTAHDFEDCTIGEYDQSFSK